MGGIPGYFYIGENARTGRWKKGAGGSWVTRDVSGHEAGDAPCITAGGPGPVIPVKRCQNPGGCYASGSDNIHTPDRLSTPARINGGGSGHVPIERIEINGGPSPSGGDNVRDILQCRGVGGPAPGGENNIRTPTTHTGTGGPFAGGDPYVPLVRHDNPGGVDAGGKGGHIPVTRHAEPGGPSPSGEIGAQIVPRIIIDGEIVAGGGVDIEETWVV